MLEDAVARIRAAGALVLLDAKRGDIGSTMDAYADYLRSDHPMQVDALTVSPYLGPESLEPAAAPPRASGGGLFVLAGVQPGGRALQHALVGAVGRAGRRRHRPRLEHPRLGRRRPGARHRRSGRWRLGPATGPSASSAPPCRLDVDLDGLGGPILAPARRAGRLAADLRRLFGTSRRCATCRRTAGAADLGALEPPPAVASTSACRACHAGSHGSGPACHETAPCAVARTWGDHAACTGGDHR